MFKFTAATEGSNKLRTAAIVVDLLIRHKIPAGLERAGSFCRME